MSSVAENASDDNAAPNDAAADNAAADNAVVGFPPSAIPSPARLAARRRVLFWARLSFILVGLAPWWLPLLQLSEPLSLLGHTIELPFMFVCHQLPERTIHVAGHAMPLCSRCAGIFSGLALGAILCWPRLTVKRARVLLALGGLLMLADVVTQDLGLHPVWHPTRLLSGGLLGWIACAALMTAIIGAQPAHASKR